MAAHSWKEIQRLNDYRLTEEGVGRLERGWQRFNLTMWQVAEGIHKVGLPMQFLDSVGMGAGAGLVASREGIRALGASGIGLGAAVTNEILKRNAGKIKAETPAERALVRMIAAVPSISLNATLMRGFGLGLKESFIAGASVWAWSEGWRLARNGTRRLARVKLGTMSALENR